MKKLFTLIPLVLLMVGCTYRNVGLLNDAVIADIEAGIADVDGYLLAERTALWDAKVEELGVGFRNDVARIGQSSLSWSEKLAAYEKQKTKLGSLLRQAALNLDDVFQTKRKNRLQNFINAHKTASGIKEVLASYVDPDWEAIADLISKAKLKILTGGF